MSLTPTPKAVPLNEMSPLLLGLIDEGIDVTFTVTGMSMTPLWYSLRDSVVLTKCDPLALKRGDVPLYLRGSDRYILHRIVKVNKDSYCMVGDRQTDIERNVPKTAVLCVVKGFYRKGKYHDCRSFGYRLYSNIWMMLRPFRKIIFGTWHFLRKIFKGGK